MLLNNKKRLWIFISVVVITILIILFFWWQHPTQNLITLLSQQGIKKPNIILITLDTTRADHLSCYGSQEVHTPYLDSVAQEGFLFDYCISPVALTLPAHASIMTGLNPTFHGVRVNGNTALSEKHHTLAETFSQEGYQCGAFIASFVLDGRWGLKQGFHYYDDQFDMQKYKRLDLGLVQRPGKEVMEAAISWMQKQQGHPFFSWIHLYEPHTPYEPPEPFRSQYHNGKLSGLYNGEIAYMDSLIGRCLSWMESQGLDKNTILVIMGDHGEGLGDHGELSHGYYVYDYAVHVPLLIRLPIKQFKGIHIKDQVRSIDIFPTLLAITGVKVPPENQGQSLVPLLSGKKETGSPDNSYAYSESMTPFLQYGWSALHSIRSQQYKYIDAPKAELYDLKRDPRELNNLIRTNSSLAKKLKKQLDQMMAQSSKGAPEPETANLDQDTLKRLATLGYIGGPVKTKKKGSNQELADPKDKLIIFEKISMAAEHISREKYNDALTELEAVLAQDSYIPQAKLLLATTYNHLKRTTEAKTVLDQLLKEDPNSLQALISLANILSTEGKDEDVITLCKKAIAVDDHNTQAYTLIGEVYMARKDHQNAEPYIRKAVEIQPKLTQNRQNLAACLLGLKRYAEAEQMLQEIIRETPKFPLAHFHLGLLKEEQGLFAEARHLYEQEISNANSCVAAHFNLAKLLFQSGDLTGYLAQMQQVVSLAPAMAEGHLFLARGWLKMPERPLGPTLELVQKGLSLAQSPQIKALGYFLLADIYARQKRTQLLQEALKKANYYKNQTEKIL